ncbi:MAG: HEAT repeat domain-containing protein [Planctomycetales bacterium]|nr:HEAT repeat domain-containing protein [Planctomycetales bacterium]
MGTMNSASGQGLTWAAARQQFADQVAAENLPEDISSLRELSLDASVSPIRRAAAVRELGRRKDIDSMPTVITVLQDSVPEVRREAYEAAKQIVGLGVRFRDYDPPAKRESAVAAYGRLYKLGRQHNIRFFVDLIPVLLDHMDSEDPAVRQTAGADVVRLLETDFGFQSTAPRPQRLQAIALYRREWAGWSAPGSRMLEIRRDPQQLQKLKAEQVKYIREKEARGEVWTSDATPPNENPVGM